MTKNHATENGTQLRDAIGLFTGGGIAPGLNAVTASATMQLREQQCTAVGLQDGWASLLDPQKEIINLSGFTEQELKKLLREPATILGSSRTKIRPDQYDRVRATADRHKLKGVIAIGGDDTLGQAREMYEAGVLNVVGVPKTIDNDIVGTDRTFGFETAYHEAAQRIWKMRADACSMRRVAVVEVMGRNAGWITLYAGKAGGADITLIPEFPIPENTLLQRIGAIYGEKRHVVIALAEGYAHAEDESLVDGFGHKKKRGAAQTLAKNIKEKTKLETQEEVVGYDVRNGEPLASDAIFAAELGACAGYLASNDVFGYMVALRNGKITPVPLSEVQGGRLVTREWYDSERMAMHHIPLNIAVTMDVLRLKVTGALGTMQAADNPMGT